MSAEHGGGYGGEMTVTERMLDGAETASNVLTDVLGVFLFGALMAVGIDSTQSGRSRHGHGH